MTSKAIILDDSGILASSIIHSFDEANLSAKIALKEALYHYTIRTGRRIKSQLIVANAWHHRSDSLSSVAVFLGVGGSLVNPSWRILDSFATLLVSFLIIKVGLEILGKSLIEFIDTAPKPEVVEKMFPGIFEEIEREAEREHRLYRHFSF